MEDITVCLLDDLCKLVADLGKDGGIVSPSIYDTAQVLRLYPPEEGVEAGLEWLLAQQQADGGWGNPAVPASRDVPTLATILALHKYRKDPEAARSIRAGLAFLAEQASQWNDIHIDAVPIAAEMLVPYLLGEAHAAGFQISATPYNRLFQWRTEKLRKLQHIQLKPAIPPTHSWEALDQTQYQGLVDAAGSIGHSPAATAAWLHNTANVPAVTTHERTAAINYLASAQAATGLNIPGVMPVVYPITGFEFSYGLYALLIADLLHRPEWANSVDTHARRILEWTRVHHGLDTGYFFTPDADSTSVGLAVLDALGHRLDTELLTQFALDDHFVTFRHELNPSILSNAHVLYTLCRFGQPQQSVAQFLLKRQHANGAWLPDKWHSSWYYSTLEVTIPLLQMGFTEATSHVPELLGKSQNQDGGWGYGGKSNALETSYSLLTLLTLIKAGVIRTPDFHGTFEAGYRWLINQYKPGQLVDEKLWLGKELYSPKRVDTIYVLVTLLAIEARQKELSWMSLPIFQP